MTYREYKPAEQLQELVSNFWYFAAAETKGISFPIAHEVLPDCAVSVVLINQPYFKGIRLLGPHTEKLQQTVHANSFYLGIRINPWIQFTPPVYRNSEILNSTTACPQSVADHFSELLNDLKEVDEVFLNRLEGKLRNMLAGLIIQRNEIIKFICIEITSGKKINAILNQMPFSERVVQKKFKEVVGVTMQQFAGTIRQRQLWADSLKQRKNELDLIYNYNFYDQAHFINDFKNKMQRTHTDFAGYLSKIDISLI